jgi:sarcosine oxidase subunit alpha
VGFYYRAFFRPRGAWRFWEPYIRRIAGLGRVDVNAPHG